jgi:hypothetical protein
MAIVQGKRAQAGAIVVTVSANGLQPANVVIISQSGSLPPAVL